MTEELLPKGITKYAIEQLIAARRAVGAATAEVKRSQGKKVLVVEWPPLD
ncbi:MAG: hypothetical protein Kilf2KO_48110 [Rhodospirillales bacterium]